MVWALEISNSFEPIRYLKEMRFHVSVDSPNNDDFPSFLINKIIWQLSSVLGTILKIVKKCILHWTQFKKIKIKKQQQKKSNEWINPFRAMDSRKGLYPASVKTMTWLSN